MKIQEYPKYKVLTVKVLNLNSRHVHIDHQLQLFSTFGIVLIIDSFIDSLILSELPKGLIIHCLELPEGRNNILYHFNILNHFQLNYQPL